MVPKGMEMIPNTMPLETADASSGRQSVRGHRDREYDGGAEHGTQNDTAQHDDGWVIRHGGCHVVAAHIETETCSGDDRRIGTDRSEERSYKF